MGLPDDMLAGIDDLVSETNASRSLVIREACHFYIEEKRKNKLRERMKAGYQEMAEINRMLAEEMAADFIDLDCGIESKNFPWDWDTSSRSQPQWRKT